MSRITFGHPFKTFCLLNIPFFRSSSIWLIPGSRLIKHENSRLNTFYPPFFLLHLAVFIASRRNVANVLRLSFIEWCQETERVNQSWKMIRSGRTATATTRQCCSFSSGPGTIRLCLFAIVFATLRLQASSPSPTSPWVERWKFISPPSIWRDTTIPTLWTSRRLSSLFGRWRRRPSAVRSESWGRRERFRLMKEMWVEFIGDFILAEKSGGSALNNEQQF